MIEVLVAKLRMYILRNFKNYKTKKTRNRKYFEYKILPFFYTKNNFQKILIVGIADYTMHYEEYFKKKHSVYTIDIDKNKTRYGIKNHHIVDCVSNVDKYFKKNSLDCVIMNGVYGWGLNKEHVLKKSLEKIYKVLKKNGILMFGWNKTSEHDPCDLDSKSSYFRLYKEYDKLGCYKMEVPESKNNHIFLVYKKS